MAERRSAKQLQIDEVEQNGKKDEREKDYMEAGETGGGGRTQEWVRLQE